MYNSRQAKHKELVVIMSRRSEKERSGSISDCLPQTLFERGTEILKDVLKSPIFSLAPVNELVPSFARDGKFRDKYKHRVLHFMDVS